jgi:hypothetical protein
MVSLEDEVMIVEQVLKSFNTEVDPIALFLSGRPVQFCASGGLAENPYHSHFAISHHVEVTTDTEVGSVSLEDRCSGVLQEVKFLLTKLASGAFYRLDKLASPLVFRHMISEVIRESDELEHFLLSRGLGKVPSCVSRE